MTGNSVTSGATLEAIMSEQDSIVSKMAHDQSRLVELSEQQLDSAVGGVHLTKTVDQASPNLFTRCCTGKHFPSAS
jgi:type VI protein secretion system component Hcp